MVTMPRLGTIAACAALGLVACSTMSVRVETVAEPQAPIATVKRVVLTPLVNRADDPGAAQVLRAVLAHRLVTEAGFEVVDLPLGVTVDPERLDRDQARDVAQAANADAVVTGIVFAYGYLSESASPPKPTVRLDVRLFAAGAPDLVWAARASAVDSPGMASAGASMTTLADAVARKIASDLASRK
jgi:hypothetical protein